MMDLKITISFFNTCFHVSLILLILKFYDLIEISYFKVVLPTILGLLIDITLVVLLYLLRNDDA